MTKYHLPTMDAAKPVTEYDEALWRRVAQPGELEFHKGPNIRSSDEWESSNERLWTKFGLERTDFEGKYILDVGAGSRLRGKFFRGAQQAIIEPLGQQFATEVPWNDLDDAQDKYYVPAENLVDALVNQCDFVFSVNVLDHCYHFSQIVNNIYRYLKRGGVALLTFDEHHTTDDCHPLVITHPIARDVILAAGFRIDKFMHTAPYHASISKRSLTYWLTRTFWNR